MIDLTTNHLYIYIEYTHMHRSYSNYTLYNTLENRHHQASTVLKKVFIPGAAVGASWGKFAVSVVDGRAVACVAFVACVDCVAWGAWVASVASTALVTCIALETCVVWDACVSGFAGIACVVVFSRNLFELRRDVSVGRFDGSRGPKQIG